jgi:hypothetical protein
VWIVEVDWCVMKTATAPPMKIIWDAVWFFGLLLAGLPGCQLRFLILEPPFVPFRYRSITDELAQ